MAKYSVISDVSKTLVELLQRELVPEPVAQPEQIGVCDPQERGNCVVGIHIYDIAQSGEMRTTTMIPQADGTLRNPPVALYLSVMISVVSKAEKETRALDEQMIMGRIIQVLEDYKRLPTDCMPASLQAAGEPICISSVPMELEEKTKIWTMFSQSYKLCVFYQIGPVLLESASITKPMPRVQEVRLESQQKQGGQG